LSPRFLGRELVYWYKHELLMVMPNCFGVRLAPVAALAVLAVCAGCGGTQGPSHAAFRGTVLAPPPAAPVFTLHDQRGARAGLATASGHYVVVTFLYTHCVDVCPLIAGMLNRVLQTPIAHRAGLRVLAVSVDPRRDTPSAVSRFVREHHLVPAFRYLTGTRAELEPVWKAFHIASTPGPNGVVAHSSAEFLIDPQGRERLLYDSVDSAAAIVHDLSLLEASA
jgi:protein SCO1/2